LAGLQGRQCNWSKKGRRRTTVEKVGLLSDGERETAGAMITGVLELQSRRMAEGGRVLQRQDWGEEGAE
jgi:hypothetical protein